MISINGILNENLDLLIEGELFNGSANLGIRLKENNQTKFEVEKINAVILPNLHDDEILIGPDFLLKDLKCRRLIINYEEFYFKVVI